MRNEDRWTIEETRWGKVLTDNLDGKHYRLNLPPEQADDMYRQRRGHLITWVELPSWSRPTAAFIRATDEQRRQNYRRIALAELDEDFDN